MYMYTYVCTCTLIHTYVPVYIEFFILVGLNTLCLYYVVIEHCHIHCCAYRMVAKTSDASEEEALRQFTTLSE